MALRLIEFVVPDVHRDVIQELLKDRETVSIWYDKLDEQQLLTKIVVSMDKSGPILDMLEKRFSMIPGFRVVILPVEASIPRPKSEEEEPEIVKKPKEKKFRLLKIGREELYTDISDTSELTTIYAVLVIISTIVAAIGMLKDNVAVVIGAMVIAPLLGPSIALSLSTTLGDLDLARKSIRANSAGILLTLLLSVIIGYFMTVDTGVSEIQSRTIVGLDDIGIAIASGSAGAIFFMMGISTALVGVMLAVALLPPLVTLGLLIGSGNIDMAFDASLLFIANFICINLAGVVTFYIAGVSPISWWEADKAKKSTLQATTLWIILLMLLITVLMLAQK